MIIDPSTNLLEPAWWPRHGGIGANTKSGEVNIRGEASPNMDELPPPYTEIDLERGIIEGPEPPFSEHNRFTNYHMGTSECNMKAPSGIRHIKEGTQIFYDSVKFFAETSLLTLGTCIEGFGKILCGIGMIMKPHHNHCSIPDN